MESNGHVSCKAFGFPSGMGFGTNELGSPIGIISMSPVTSRDDIYKDGFKPGITPMEGYIGSKSPVMPQKISDACPDVITMHTIDLLHHHRQLSKYLALQNESRGKSLTQAPPPEKIPELPDSILKYRRPGDLKKKNKISSSLKCKIKKEKADGDSTGACVFSERGADNKYLHPFNRDLPGATEEVQPNCSNVESNFVQGIGELPPKISQNVAWKILRKSVAVIFAHAGYETMGSNTLDILTDIAQDYLVRIVSVLRKNEDKKALTDHTVFVDVVEQTFHDIGLGSMTSLHYFYQSRIVDYHEHMMMKCQEVMRDYKKHLERLNDDPENTNGADPEEDVEEMDVDEYIH